MKSHLNRFRMTPVVSILAISITALPNVGAQQVPGFRDAQEATLRTQRQEKLQQVLYDQAGYAATIVRRWEADARASGRWDENYATDLQNALMKLLPENLLAAGEAPSYNAMMGVLMTGRPFRDVPQMSVQPITPQSLGDTTDDLVFTPLTPCRIVDTRNAGGAIAGNTTRSFDVDGSTFTGQGGFNGSCGIPFGVPRAVAMTLTVTQPSASGYFTVWPVGSQQPLASTLNFVAGETTATTTIVPVVPGGGNDFNLFVAQATAHVVIDVVGYYAAPVATALDCTTVSSAVTSVGVNAWTAIDATCPSGRTATGGGYNTPEGTLGYPGVWITTLPSGNGWRTWVDNQTNGNRSIQTYVQCCRLPGR